MRRCRGARSATRCRIATASPARNSWRRCAIAPTACPRDPPPTFTNAPDPESSAGHRTALRFVASHPVGWLTVAGFETLDPTAFSIVCLAQNGSQDWMARRFRSLAREWHDVDTLSDTALAAKARALGIDILIDLGGYGDAARMTACAYRMAPVQIKWVGMQSHSSGLRGDGLVHHRSLGNAARVGALLFRTAAASARWLCLLQRAALCTGCRAACPHSPTDTSRSAASTTWPRSRHV